MGPDNSRLAAKMLWARIGRLHIQPGNDLKMFQIESVEAGCSNKKHIRDKEIRGGEPGGWGVGPPKGVSPGQCRRRRPDNGECTEELLDLLKVRLVPATHKELHRHHTRDCKRL